MSISIATKRLAKEAAELRKMSLPGIRVRVDDKNLFRWTAEVDGPVETPYEGGTFEFSIAFTSEYPMVAPKVKCETRVYHVNINSAWIVCLDLKANWTPVLTVCEILRAIQTLLAQPNPDDPLVPSIAVVASSDPAEYLKRATLFTRRYACIKKIIPQDSVHKHSQS